uniref:putative barnase/colicin E5 family endoribonuclease n=1 Tax=Campylobacter fetus TaxID=196 RepID=UPI003AF85E39
MSSIIPQSTSKKQVLQSTKDKIENKQKLNLKEKKALVEEKRAETKVKKAAKAEQILKSDNVEFLDWLKDTSTNKFYAEVQKQEKALQNQQQYLKDIDSFLQGLTLKNKERQILFTHGFSKDELIIARDKIIKQIEKDNKELAPFLALLRKKEANDKATSQTIKAQQERINMGKSMLSGFKEVYQDGIISDEQIVKTKGGIVSLFNDPMANTPETRKYLLDSSFRNRIEKAYNISPIKEFGTNYAEFYHDGSNAIKKLLVEKQGQVAGAFERKELGDIDLVWGEVDKKLNGYGLAKIEAKHLNDFANFNGANPTEKMINGISEIIEKGEIKIDNNGRATIVYNKNDKVYKIGLKQNWQGNPTENKWIVTAYDDIREAHKIINSKGFTKGETLPLNSNSDIISQKAAKSNELSLADNIVSLSNKINDDFKQVSKYLNEYIDEKISINRSINRDFGIDTMRVEYVDHNGNYKFKNIKRIESIKDLEKLIKLRIRGDQFNAIISNSNAKKITDNILEDLNQLKALKAKQAELNKANAQANKDLEIKQKRENELNLYSIPEVLRNNEKLSDGLIALKKMFAKDYSDKGAYKYSIAKTHGIDENGFKNMLQENRRGLEKILNINPIKEFGTNYAEFYHDGSNAIKKLLAEKQGQVAGAFEKDGKDITLVLGIEGTSHSDGYGLAKIAKYHPEAVDKLDNIISKGEFYKDEKGRLNIKYNDDIVGLRENWLGNETAPWIISSYTKKVETSKGINSASSITPSKENYSFTTQHNNIIPQNSKEVNPTSNKVFANEHIGGGLVGGTLNGVETDENGNISFDPAKFALGFLAGAGGVAGIKRANKFLADNPQFKQAFKNEIAKTLSNGWENAKAKNPLLKTLETNSYIVPNEKGVSPEDVIKASQNLAKDDYHGINLKEQKSIKQVVEANSKITDTSIKAGEFAKPKGDSTYTKAWDSYERLVDRGFDKLEELVKNTVKKGVDLPGGAVSKILNNFLDFESGGKAVGEVFQNYRELTYKNSSLSSKIYKGLSTLSNKNIKSLFHALFLE